MTEFERITVSPSVLGAFLSSLPCLGGPWDDAFHFGRDMLAKELESAAASIEDLTDRTEGAENETD